MGVKFSISQSVSGFQISGARALRFALLNCSCVNVELACNFLISSVKGDAFPPIQCTWIQWDERPSGAVSLHLVQRKHKQLGWLRLYQTPNYLWWEEKNLTWAHWRQVWICQRKQNQSECNSEGGWEETKWKLRWQILTAGSLMQNVVSGCDWISGTCCDTTDCWSLAVL